MPHTHFHVYFPWFASQWATGESISVKTIRLVLRIIVGWGERSETQQTHENVGFRSSTQPTQMKAFWR